MNLSSPAIGKQPSTALSEVAYILTGQPALRLDLSVNLYEV
jgi:hypothetical protein